MVRRNELWEKFPRRTRNDEPVKSYIPVIKKAEDGRRKCPICNEHIKKGKKVVMYFSWFRYWRLNFYPEFRYAHLDCVLEHAEAFPSPKDVKLAKRKKLTRSI